MPRFRLGYYLNSDLEAIGELAAGQSQPAQRPLLNVDRAHLRRPIAGVLTVANRILGLLFFRECDLYLSHLLSF